MEPILKSTDGVNQQVRILRPSEVRLLLTKGITKFEHQVMFKALLYSGMRYAEAKRFQNNPQWFDGNFIHTPNLKKMSRQKDRWIHLNPQGREVMSTFLQIKKKLPAVSTWYTDLIRWSRRAGLSIEGFSPKTTRKTWESWLVFYYPEKQTVILQSQGHTDVVSFDYYLSMPFTEEEKLVMKSFVEGWM